MKIIGYAVIHNTTNEPEGKLYRRTYDAKRASLKFVRRDYSLPPKERQEEARSRAEVEFRIAPLVEMPL